MQQSTLSLGQSDRIGLVRAAGSLRVARWLIALLGIAVLAAHAGLLRFDQALALPASLMVLNLLAALATQPAMRRQGALLAFHLGLVAVLVLVVAGRLTYLAGRIEVTSGTAFEGQWIDGERGLLHAGDLRSVRFVNDGFEISYAPGLKRGSTRNQVRWLGDDGRERSGIIGDHQPLVLRGYRFYTTPNKGFAPVFTWRAAGDDELRRGAVHLPSFPVHRHEQARQWRPPRGGPQFWVMLSIEPTLLDPGRDGRFRLPRMRQLVVRVDTERHELAPGESLVLPQGTLHYEGLRTWMGYRVRHDPTLPWLLAAALFSALALAAHYLARWRRSQGKRPDANP